MQELKMTSELLRYCERACAGDSASFEVLFQSLRGYLTSVLSGILRDSRSRSYQDDLLQDWCCEVWSKRETTVCKAAHFADDTSVCRFLGAILRNHALKWIQRRLGPSSVQLNEDHSHTEQRRTEQIDAAYALLGVVQDRLKPEDRLILDLALQQLEQQGTLSMKELATQLSLTQGEMSAIFRRIRQLGGEIRDANDRP